jgi:hypothetical protein
MTGEGSATSLFTAFIEAARSHAAQKRQAAELSPVGANGSE